MSEENTEVQPEPTKPIVKEETPTEPVVESVSMDAHKKALAELEKFKEKANVFQEGLKAKELEQMKAQNKWQEIAELEKKEKEEIKEKYGQLNQAVANREKMTAIKLAAQQAGIRSDALNHLEHYQWSDVQIETTSLGNINIVGASEAIARFKMESPFMFGKKSTSLNSAGPEVVEGAKITIQQVLAAQKKAQKSNQPSDYDSYSNILRKYQTQ